jgi:hypothetical protein
MTKRKLCVTADRPEDLGCVFDVVNTNDIVVTNFSFPGRFNVLSDRPKTPIPTDACVDRIIKRLFVPSHASKDMVKNALARS